MLDAPALLASGDVDVYLDVLKRLLPLFVRFRKQNYIVIVSYVIAAVTKVQGTNDEKTFCDALQHLSSEDLEVFHSLLRASSRHQDTQAQISRKALMITSRSTSPLTILKKWSDLVKAVENDDEVTRNECGLGRTPEERCITSIEMMKEHLRSLFQNLAANADSFVITASADMVPSLKKPEIFYCLKVKSENKIISPAKQHLSGLLRGRKLQATTKESATGCIIARISERLLPLQLIQATNVLLNKHVDIGKFQSQPLPSPPPKHTRIRVKMKAAALAVEPPPASAVEQLPNTTDGTCRPMISTMSLDGLDILTCGCQERCRCEDLMNHICQSEMAWFIQNTTSGDS